MRIIRPGGRGLRNGRVALITASALALLACEGVGGIADEPPTFPTAKMAEEGVVLQESPAFDDLAHYYCEDTLGDFACSLAFDGAVPKEDELIFSFDTIYELGNGNSFPVPMVELLLAVDVFPGDADKQELGALCVSFCDPEGDAECDPTKPNPDACKAPTGEDGEEVKDIKDIDDFIPTTDELIDFGRKALDGEALDELKKFKFIPSRGEQSCRPEGECEEGEMDGAPAMCCGGECTPLPGHCTLGEGEQGDTCMICDGQLQATVGFQFGVQKMLSIVETLVVRSIDSFISGDDITFDIPYSIEVTLFFDVPVLGRFAATLGPFEDTWKID